MTDDEFLVEYKKLISNMTSESDPVRIRFIAEAIKDFAIAHSIQRRDVLGLSSQNRSQ